MCFLTYLVNPPRAFHYLPHPERPSETFDVVPFIDRRCKHPVEEVQAAVDGAIFHEQAVKLRGCLQHLDELGTHKTSIEKESLRLAQQYPHQLELLQTVPSFSGNIMTAIALISEIGADMPVPSFRKAFGFLGGLLLSQRSKL